MDIVYTRMVTLSGKAREKGTGRIVEVEGEVEIIDPNLSKMDARTYCEKRSPGELF